VIPIHIKNILTLKIHNLSRYKFNSKFHLNEAELYYIPNTKGVRNLTNNNLFTFFILKILKFIIFNKKTVFHSKNLCFNNIVFI